MHGFDGQHSGGASASQHDPTLAGEPSVSRSWRTQGREGGSQFPFPAQEPWLRSLSWRVGVCCDMLVMEVAKGPAGCWSQEQHR